MKISRFIIGMALGLVLIASSAAVCQQLFVFKTDLTWTESGNRKDNDIFWPKEENGDGIYWGKAGIDDPHLYMKIDIWDRPSNDELCLWLCLWNTNSPDQEVCNMEGRDYADGSGKMPCYSIKEDGTYYFDYYRVLAWRGSHSGSYQYDVDMPLVRVLPQLRLNGAKLKGSTSDGHVPIESRFEIYIVQHGQNLATPEGWTCPAEWNCSGSTAANHSVSHSPSRPDFFTVASQQCAISSDGPHTVKLMDTRGRVLKQFSGSGKAEYDIAGENTARGMHLLSIESGKQSAVVPVMMR
jgi:hypothetical protein